MDQLLNTKQILETLSVQPLSEEEKSRRHILKRLAGPIATYVDKTRNDRLYNEELWNRQLNDEILKEKIQNKSLFLELGHPTDGREAIDPTKACACIPTLPKIVNGDLYGVIDVLDTPNGRLLNTLIEYGFKPGISSRGSGELGEDNVVDPDSFFLETWDIVPLPAVKKARLSVVESLDTKKSKTLAKALNESLDKANENDKQIMKEALDNIKDDINIKLSEDAKDDQGLIDIEDLPTTYKGLKVKNIFVDDLIKENLEESAEDLEEVEAEKTEAEAEAPVEDIPAEAEVEETADVEENSDNADEATEDEQVKLETAADLAKAIKDLAKEHCKNDKVEFEFEPIDVNGQTISIEGLDISENSTEDKLVLKLITDYNPEETQDDNIDETIPEDTQEENQEIEAEDLGSDELVESLKEMVRQKEQLENKIKSLTKEKTVSDAKVKKLEEDVNRFESGFIKTSEIAANAIKFKADNTKLVGQLAKAKEENFKVTSELAHQKELNEELKRNSTELSTVTAKCNSQVDSMKKELEKVKLDSQNKVNLYNKKMNEALDAAKNAKNKLKLVLNKYIESKASMLGVNSKVITEKLDPKGYSLTDIDKICNEILEGNMNFGRSINLSLNESISKNKLISKQTNPADDYSDIDPMLLEIAGLK